MSDRDDKPNGKSKPPNKTPKDNKKDSGGSDEDAGGYGRPPKAGQFKPGQSGNPKGRPKGSRNMKTDLDVALRARMSVTKDGKSVTMTTQQVIIARLIEKSLKGDIRALSKLFDLVGLHLPDEKEIVTGRVSRSDADILNAFKQSLQADDEDGTVEDNEDDGGENDE